MDPTDPHDPVVVEPVVNVEKLRELLAWQAEIPDAGLQVGLRPLTDS
jgi:hypothetical protein